MLHCYIVEPQWLTVLHNLLHAVTLHRWLIINRLRCYINVIVELNGCNEEDVTHSFLAIGATQEQRRSDSAIL